MDRAACPDRGSRWVRVLCVSGNRPLYSIGAVAEMLGSSPATLRSREERAGVIAPRAGSGRPAALQPR